MMPRIAFHSLFLFLILHVSLAKNDVAFAGEQAFPFRAEAIEDQVNVRAGQSTNFEVIGQLKKGEEVFVLEKGYGWYKVQLPASAKSYVHKEYIQFLGQDAGGVLGDRINVRAGAGTHYTILGQLMKGEQIFIEEELKEWYRIRPVLGSYGWVAEEYLAFKSEDVKEYQEALAAKIFLDLEPLPSLGTAKNITDEKTESKDPKATEEAEEEEIFYAVGYVEAYQDDENDGIYYKITAGGRPVCYVQGVNEMLGRFKNLRVSVEGKVNKNLRSKYAYPVIIVSKIRLML